MPSSCGSSCSGGSGGMVHHGSLINGSVCGDRRRRRGAAHSLTFIPPSRAGNAGGDEVLAPLEDASLASALLSSPQAANAVLTCGDNCHQLLQLRLIVARCMQSCSF